MEIVDKRLKELNPLENNPRKISEYELEKLKDSIVKFGFVEPIIWNKQTNHIVGGHQRHKALLALHGEEFVTQVIAVDLPAQEEKTLNVALNKISGEWDMEKLNQILTGIEPSLLEFTGFSQLEIENLLAVPIPAGNYDGLGGFEPDNKLKVIKEEPFFTEPEHRAYMDFLEATASKRRETLVIDLIRFGEGQLWKRKSPKAGITSS